MIYLKSEKTVKKLLRQNVILTWMSFPDRKQGVSGEKLRMFIEMNFSAAAIIDEQVSPCWKTMSYPRKLSLRNEASRTTGREF
ncbi:hypothetical protein Y032_0200g1695 [Ancylostoma ceylanicum]|uniref:Uncharacterized protein n=1 Tax=Ancylostoma ceylanicum TaxID=53326 RepID=A0A016SNN5_9BILA|nr:hypothetical protein Y032_0200g1695 [Ancylostoma ceylanicum]